MDWAPSDGTTLHVVGLRDGRTRSFRAPPCFVFHWANAHESPDGRHLHLDACLYEEPGIVNDLRLAALRADYRPGSQPGRAYLRRFTLDLDAPNGGPAGVAAGAEGGNGGGSWLHAWHLHALVSRMLGAHPHASRPRRQRGDVAAAAGR
jgi:hypothetical protein